MSDIHGRYDKFTQMLRHINFSKIDKLYILGDVIDRGEEPILLLNEIMEKDNIHLLMGNHEYMMINALMHNVYIDTWVYNGGYTTLDKFLELNEKDKQDILEYLYHLPVIIPSLTVNGQCFYLSHSAPPNIKLEKTEYMYTLKESLLDSALWERVDLNVHLPLFSTLYPERILLSGHTIVSHYSDSPLENHIFHSKDGIFIDIDCGCARFDDNIARLGCLRLDDMKEFYT